MADTVVLSPHLDDAVCSAWTVLRMPGDVRVVNVCAGAPPLGVQGRWDRMTGAADSRTRLVERAAEDRAALALAGREPVNLEFLDDQYREGPLPARRLRAELARAVEGARAVHAPAGLGGHPDHVAVREVAIKLARARGLRLSLYAELPYAVRFGWPHWVTGSPRRAKLAPEARWEQFLATASCPTAELEVRVTPVSETEAAAKLRALQAYETQFAALDAGPLERLRHPDVRRWEVSWAWVRPA